MYIIEFDEKAAEFLRKLDKESQQRIGKKIELLKENPELGKPLTANLSGLRSLRIWDYRAVYQIKNNELLIFVLRLGHRKNIYDKL